MSRAMTYRTRLLVKSHRLVCQMSERSTFSVTNTRLKSWGRLRSGTLWQDTMRGHNFELIGIRNKHSTRFNEDYGRIPQQGKVVNRAGSTLMEAGSPEPNRIMCTGCRMDHRAGERPRRTTFAALARGRVRANGVLISPTRI